MRNYTMMKTMNSFAGGVVGLLIVILTMMMIGMPLALAQTPLQKCGVGSGLAWTLNAEPDMDLYRVRYSDAANVSIGGVGVQSFDVIHDPTAAIPDPNDATKRITKAVFPVSLPEGPNYFMVTAVDKAGNESIPSNEVACDFDKAPGAPIIFLQFN